MIGTNLIAVQIGKNLTKWIDVECRAEHVCYDVC
jgi:hypothetical protein